MLVKTSLSRTLVLPEVTNRPKMTLVAMLREFVWTGVHAEPLIEVRAAMLVPVRTSCTQQLAKAALGVLVLVVAPPVLVRLRTTTGPFPCRAANMKREPVAVVSRIMTPA